MRDPVPFQGPASCGIDRLGTTVGHHGLERRGLCFDELLNQLILPWLRRPHHHGARQVRTITVQHPAEVQNDQLTLLDAPVTRPRVRQRGVRSGRDDGIKRRPLESGSSELQLDFRRDLRFSTSR
jgi:hypothetical protein